MFNYCWDNGKTKLEWFLIGCEVDGMLKRFFINERDCRDVLDKYIGESDYILNIQDITKIEDIIKEKENLGKVTLISLTRLGRGLQADFN